MEQVINFYVMLKCIFHFFTNAENIVDVKSHYERRLVSDYFLLHIANL
jgi:hypothetical protein